MKNTHKAPLITPPLLQEKSVNLELAEPNLLSEVEIGAVSGAPEIINRPE